ncbi:MAG: saccharopine dehydrogenase NADP-binding domain-containing protein [bacterium]
MARAIVLGGCGVVGSVALKTLALHDLFSEVRIGDLNLEKARQLASALSSSRVSAVKLHADDPDSIREAIRGCDIVLNCVGPFYKTVKTVLETVIGAGIPYVDICDDVDVTLDIFRLDADAKRAGITALIGMGASPGATNLFAKFVADNLLDETDSIDIFHTHGGEPVEGPGVIGHRFHCMSIDIPMFLNGELKYVKFFEPDGLALRQTFDFPVVGTVPVFPYPHPEQVTLPKYIKTRQVTNKGSVLPIEYYELISTLCRAGLARKEPLQVGDRQVVPHDFAVAYIIRERDRILRAQNFGEQRGAMSVIVKGRKEGAYREYRIHSASRGRALGEGTGVPAAMGAILLQQGKVTAKGVLPPEACVAPADFFALYKQLGADRAEGDKEGGLLAEMVDENGKVAPIQI